MAPKGSAFLEPGERLVLVSNRLPVVLRRSEEGLEVRSAAGGLASGLGAPHREGGGPWIGWPGLVTPDGRLPAEVREALAARRMKGVGLRPEEHHRYYTLSSNRCLWPLCHYFTEEVRFDPEAWRSYEAINRRFAEATLEEVRDGDLVFVHDFHLALVPGLLREARPDLRIGFFLHIPFPSSEVWRILPVRRQVLEGLLGADFLGFHTLDYLRHFRVSLRRVLGLEPGATQVEVGRRTVRFAAEPLGIDGEAWIRRAGQPATAAALGRLREAAAKRRVILGVDRLDYTKGIPARLQAFRTLLERRPELAEEVLMIQVAVPSRVEADEYRSLKEEVDRLAGEINAAFGRPGLQPLHYQFRGVPPEELSALYQLADVALVTPLRDGLNLVAKEFVASRTREDGVLVLGEFTGAAWELGEALLVNPFDREGLADALEEALAMPAEEQRRRMAPMRRRVLRHDVHRWTARCLEGIRRARLPEAPPLLRGSVREDLFEAWAAARDRVLFLDYDGTLREFAPRPELAAPDPALLDLLQRLGSAPSLRTWIVSGRTAATLEEWLGGSGCGLVAEHGALLRPAGGEAFRPLFHLPDPAWKESVRPVLEVFRERVPGSHIEEKHASLAWHYRQAAPGTGPWQAAELQAHLAEVLQNLPLEVLRGDRVIEVRPQGVDKGGALREILRDAEPGLVLAAGDDRTDEDLFRALPAGGTGILVGRRPSAARYRLDSPQELRSLLAELLALLPRGRAAAGGGSTGREAN